MTTYAKYTSWACIQTYLFSNLLCNQLTRFRFWNLETEIDVTLDTGIHLKHYTTRCNTTPYYTYFCSDANCAPFKLQKKIKLLNTTTHI